MLGATLAIPFILSGPMCFANNTLVISEVLSTIFFISGIVTLLQSTFGVRYIFYMKTVLYITAEFEAQAKSRKPDYKILQGRVVQSPITLTQD